VPVGLLGVQCPVPPELPVVLYGNGSSCNVAPILDVQFELDDVSDVSLNFTNAVHVSAVYQLLHCGKDADCGEYGACTSRGMCRCAFDACGTLCDTPVTQPGGCVRPDEVSARVAANRACWMAARLGTAVPYLHGAVTVSPLPTFPCDLPLSHSRYGPSTSCPWAISWPSAAAMSRAGSP
jgi:hypothetical protein